MWLFTMFDLPVDTKEARKHYVWFRKALLRCGFMQLQYSVYARYYSCEEASQPDRNYLRSALPPHGQVRFLLVTDRQFGKMEVYHGIKRGETEKPPRQVALF